MLFLVLGELDPEVQLMLYTSARALKDAPLESRAQTAAATLLKTTPQEVERLALELEKQLRSGKAGPGGDVPDAGTPTRTRMP